MLGVDELRTAHDDDASLYVGRCSFVGDAGAAPVREHRDPSGAVLRWEDVTIDFRLTLPRDGAAFVGAAVGAAAAAGAPQLKALFDRLGPVEGTALVATEYPGIRFRLELMLSVLTFHLGKAWLPGTMDAEHRVIPAPNRTSDDVAFLLPKVTFVYEQGDDLTQPPTFELASWGSGGFDAPHDLAAGEVVRMEPPLAVHESGRFGFGVGQVVLDLSENSTPPEILRFFGVDQGWKGIYVRSARVYWSDKDKGWAVNVAVEDVLVSFAGQVSLEASLDVIGPEARMRASVHLFEGPLEVMYVKGTTTPLVPGEGTILNTGVVHVHIAGGVPPYVVHARLGSEELWNATNRTAPISPGGAAALRAPVRATLHVSVTDSGTTTAPNPTQQAYLEDIDLTVRAGAAPAAPRDGAPADRPPERTTRPSAVFKILDRTPSTLAPGYDVTCTPSASGLTERVVVSGPPGATVTVGGVARALDATGSFSLDVPEAADIPVVVTWPDPSPTAPPQQEFRLRFAGGGPRADLSDIGFEGVIPDYVADVENPPDLPFAQSTPDGGPPTPTGAASLKQWIADKVAAGSGAHITIDAHARFIRPEDALLDQRLSERRLAVARAIILDARPTATFDHALAHGHASARASSSPGSAGHDVAIVAAAIAPANLTPTKDLESWIDLALKPDDVRDSATAPGFHVFAERGPITKVKKLKSEAPLSNPPGPHYVGWQALVNLGRLRSHPNDAGKPAKKRRFQVKLRLKLCYPADPNDPGKLVGSGSSAAAKLPVVVIAHGHHDSWFATPAGTDELPSHEGFVYLQQELASNGIVSVSVDSNFANFFDCLVQTRADLVVAAVRALIAANSAAGDLLFGRLDLDNVGFIGHSRGGDGVIKAAKDVRDLLVPIRLKVVCAIAPTDAKGSQQDPVDRGSLDPGLTGFFYLLYGGLDGDVDGDGGPLDPVGSGFRHYDRATCEKASAFVERCSHNRFNTEWLNHNDTPNTACLSSAEHVLLALEYIGDLMRWKLKGESGLTQRFDGQRIIPPAERASLQWSFSVGARLKVIDDFEHATSSNLGVPRPSFVKVLNMDKVPAGGSTMGDHVPHQTRVAYVDPAPLPAPSIRFFASDIPTADRDWTPFNVLLFSITGWYDDADPSSIASSPLPRVSITLTDTNDVSATVGWATYGVDRPKRPIIKTSTSDASRMICLMPLETVAVELPAFSGLDISSVKRVAFDTDPASTNVLILDNVALTKR